MSHPQDITTVNGEIFTMLESVDLARLILKRFGNIEAGAEAWRRLLQNSATNEDFRALVEYPEHTPHCEGECIPCPREESCFDPQDYLTE